MEVLFEDFWPLLPRWRTPNHCDRQRWFVWIGLSTGPIQVHELRASEASWFAPVQVASVCSCTHQRYDIVSQKNERKESTRLRAEDERLFKLELWGGHSSRKSSCLNRTLGVPNDINGATMVALLKPLLLFACSYPSPLVLFYRKGEGYMIAENMDIHLRMDNALFTSSPYVLYLYVWSLMCLGILSPNKRSSLQTGFTKHSSREKREAGEEVSQGRCTSTVGLVPLRNSFSLYFLDPFGS